MPKEPTWPELVHRPLPRLRHAINAPSILTTHRVGAILQSHVEHVAWDWFRRKVPGIVLRAEIVPLLCQTVDWIIVQTPQPARVAMLVTDSLR